MNAALFLSPRAADRIERAVRWLAKLDPARPALLVAPSGEAAADLVHRLVARSGAALFGWRRLTPWRLASALASPALAERGFAEVGSLGSIAVAARAVHRLQSEGEGGSLGRFAPIADRPGLPRALARTVAELRLAGVDARALEEVSPDLARVQRAVEEELVRARLADRALVFSLATERVRDRRPHELLDVPVLLLDLAISAPLEEALWAALTARAPQVLATAPQGDARSAAALQRALGVSGPEAEVPPLEMTALARVQRGLFSGAVFQAHPPSEDVVILSAPGESRECVEVARAILREAGRGVPFDRMAVLLRAPGQYRALLAEALSRAGVPAYWARGTMQPDPAGRALLALLACAAEGLSARRFAEYLSLGEAPLGGADGAPPPPLPAGDRWVPPDEEGDGPPHLAPLAAPEDSEPQTVPSSRRWERLIVEAAVIGGRERWARRLDGLEAALRIELAEAERAADPAAERVRRSLADLDALRRFALPLVDALAALPSRAPWGTWIDALGALATRALRAPERVLGVLAELMPMAPVGPVALPEVRLVLARRLVELAVPPSGRRQGKVFVAPIEAARGMSFDVVFVPGLAERIFPQKLSEDPALPDAERERLGAALETRAARAAGEKLQLGLAAGAASERLWLSYPRLDVREARPRVPSFYVLEVVRAAEGRLLGFDALARRAEAQSGARIGWPAPGDPHDAVDEAEHDLALLAGLFQGAAGAPAHAKGAARYLLSANPHLGRALRARARRWIRKWTPADGLVDPAPEARAALARHALAARSYSPTALQNYAACPYKFLLHAVHRLAPREQPEAIEEMDPVQYGSLVHDVQFLVLGRLHDEGLLPLAPHMLGRAEAALDAALEEVAARYRDDLAPAIERVWEDGVASARADLRVWLRRMSEERVWTPWRFELSFGLNGRRERDPHSVAEPVPLDCGIRLRGSIDLVERGPSGSLRATDHKTGKARAEEGTVIGGGGTLQPVLYALALEKLFPGAKVESGRLYYCTSAAGFSEVIIPLDGAARRAAERVAATVDEALEKGFFPAAPQERACADCDYRMVCGPHEEQRVARHKSKAELEPLGRLREEA